MYGNISNEESMNINFVTYQSRGTFGQESALRGTKLLYALLVPGDHFLVLRFFSGDHFLVLKVFPRWHNPFNAIR